MRSSFFTASPLPSSTRSIALLGSAFRSLVPDENFCEWRKVVAGKQPYAIALADRRLMPLGEMVLGSRHGGAKLWDHNGLK